MMLQETKEVTGLINCRVDEELFSASAAFLGRDASARIVVADLPIIALVIDAEGVCDIDTAAVQHHIGTTS